MIGDNRQAEYLEFDQRLDRLNQRSAELAQQRRKLKQEMREAGVEPDAFALVRRMGGRTDDEVRRWFQQLGQGLVWKERPIGFQPALFDDSEPLPKRPRGRPKGATDSYKRPPRRRRGNGPAIQFDSNG